jgi:hypothetical protein
VLGEESVTNRLSSTRAGRMLQRPPPLMRILRPPSAVRSSSSVSAPAEAAKIAASVPAAPAPMMATRRFRILPPRTECGEQAPTAIYFPCPGSPAFLLLPPAACRRLRLGAARASRLQPRFRP